MAPARRLLFETDLAVAEIGDRPLLLVRFNRTIKRFQRRGRTTCRSE
jgi:hypothetical protein